MRMSLFLSLTTLVFAIPVLANDIESSAEKKDPVLIYREAGANEEQEAKIRQFAHDYEKSAKVKVERLHNLSKQVKDLSFEAEIDERKILTVQDEINELQTTLSTERIKLMLKIRSLLSTEQKEKLVELLKAKESHLTESQHTNDTQQTLVK